MIISPKTKKTIIIFLALTFVLFVSILSSLTPEQSRIFFKATAPLIATPTPTAYQTKSLPETSPIVPKSTNYQAILTKGDPATSQSEIQKLKPELPISIRNFKTSLNQTTSVNIFTIPSEPSSLIHIEIYGINYNHPEPNQSDAIAFKESFQQAQKVLASKNINLKDLQIVFGTRQFIQDTATYWVEHFKLIN